jgi:hypothetical protein
MCNQQYLPPAIAVTGDTTGYMNVLSSTPGGELQVVTTGATVNTIGPDRHVVIGDVLVGPGHYKVIPTDYHIDGDLTIEALPPVTIGSETVGYTGYLGVDGYLNCTGTIDNQGTLFVYGSTGTSGTSGSSGTGGDIPRTSMLAWYDATTGVTTAGEFVSSWADISGNGFDLIAPTEKLPDALGVTLNGVAIPNTTLTYGDKRLVTASNFTQIGTTCTIFIVAAQYTGDGNYSRFIDNSFSNNFHFSRNSASQEVLGGVATNNEPYGAVLAADNNTFYTFRMVCNAGQTVITRNGAVSSTPYNNGTPGTAVPLAMFATSDGSFPGKKAIAELIIYNDVLSAGDIATVEDYLVGKWQHY